MVVVVAGVDGGGGLLSVSTGMVKMASLVGSSKSQEGFLGGATFEKCILEYKTIAAFEKCILAYKTIVACALSGPDDCNSVNAHVIPIGGQSINIPLPISNEPNPTELARLIQEASLIIWDEAPMISRYAFEAVDQTFKDILKSTVHCSRSRLFGGKLFVLGGDFRQILLVVTKGSREQTVAASLPNSTIWDHCHVLHLTRNMRLTAEDIPDQTRQELRDFAEWIKLIGEEKIQGTSFSEGQEPNWIQIPERFLIRNGERSLHMLIESTNLDFTNKYQDIGYLQECAILAPKHDDVDEINNIMLSMLPGEMRIYNSADKLCPIEHESNDQDMHPPELLHSLNFLELPNLCLKLKVGTPIILLRNVNLSLGLCNGTRLIVVKMGNQVIEAKVVTGSRAGEIVHLHRAVLSPSSTHSPFTMKRRQFPIKLAFSMTINKSQGQTLKNVGLYLPNSCFSHGQLYVVLSRVTSPRGLKILIVNKPAPSPHGAHLAAAVPPPLSPESMGRWIFELVHVVGSRACSYWKLSGYLKNDDGDGNSGDQDLKLDETDEMSKLPPVMEGKRPCILIPKSNGLSSEKTNSFFVSLSHL
ncbi:hypothetical protein RHMOL_Rhmol01G0137900 [Rhododendron molle]|uniref:Uncharacterized protein n=1 Tax=Rhododendron molle TaxID=49168 RepID=A0ACC0Q470_RHOML|nr:hypothetical protein RHMOL_Rhmol01G0137900 [Rhododendron molle]